MTLHQIRGSATWISFANKCAFHGDTLASGSTRGRCGARTQLVPALDDARDLSIEVVEEALHIAQPGPCGCLRSAGGRDALAGHLCQLPVSRLLGPAGRIP